MLWVDRLWGLVSKLFVLFFEFRDGVGFRRHDGDDDNWNEECDPPRL